MANLTTNQVLKPKVKQYWLENPESFAQRLQKMVRGAQVFTPECVAGKWQIDSGNTWWMWLENGIPHIDYRHKNGSTTKEQWNALQVLVEWRLGDSTGFSFDTPGNQVITTGVSQHWFRNNINQYKLILRVQDLVRGRTKPSRFAPIDTEDGWWKLNPGGHWLLHLESETISLDFQEKRTASPQQWNALKTVIEWRLG